MDFFYSIPYLLLFLWILPKLKIIRESGVSQNGIRILFGVKALMGVALILVYTYYYPKGNADIYNYFNDGKILYSALFTAPADFFRMLTGFQDDTPRLMYYYDQMNFWLKNFNYNLFNDNRTVIRFNAFFMFFSFKNIYVHTYIMNVFAVIGLVGIYRFLREAFSCNRLIVFIGVTFPLSLLFWGSGLLKEGIVLLALGLFVFSILQIMNNPKNINGYAIAILSLIIFSISKFYVLFAILPGIIGYLISRRKKNPVIIFLGVHTLFILIIFGVPFIGLPNLPEIISQKQNDFINFAHSLSHVGSFIEGPRLSPNVFDFIVQGFRGLFITLFRPHPLEVHNVAMIPAALENVGVVFLIILALIFRNKRLAWDFALICISYTFILFALAGMTTPILGALVRYKIPAQPFLYVLLLMSINGERINNILKKSRINPTRFIQKLETLLFT